MNLGDLSPSNLRPIGYVAPENVVPLHRSRRYSHEPIAGNVLPLRRRPLIETRENLVLDALPSEILRAFEPFLKPVSLTKQQTLYREDDSLDFVYFPGTAVVSEFKMLEDGRSVEVAVTGRDGAVGLSSLLLGSDLAVNTTEVSQSGTAERIPVWALTTLLDSNDDLRQSLNPFADQYIRQISQKVICNMFHSAKARLCTWLAMAHDRWHLTAVSLTHQEIARILGILRPTVTCIAQELRNSELINYSRGEISICDRKRIQQAACACYMAAGAQLARTSRCQK